MFISILSFNTVVWKIFSAETEVNYKFNINRNILYTDDRMTHINETMNVSTAIKFTNSEPIYLLCLQYCDIYRSSFSALVNR